MGATVKDGVDLSKASVDLPGSGKIMVNALSGVFPPGSPNPDQPASSTRTDEKPEIAMQRSVLLSASLSSVEKFAFAKLFRAMQRDDKYDDKSLASLVDSAVSRVEEEVAAKKGSNGEKGKPTDEIRTPEIVKIDEHIKRALFLHYCVAESKVTLSEAVFDALLAKGATIGRLKSELLSGKPFEGTVPSEEVD